MEVNPKDYKEMCSLLVELVEQYHLKGEPPNSHCRICDVYMKAKPLSYEY